MATKQELQQSIEKMVKVANNPKTAESTRSTLLKAIQKAENQLKDLEKAETLEKKEEELTEKQEKKVEEVKKESKKAVAEAKQKIKVATSKLSKKVGRPSAKPSKLMNKAKKLALKYRLAQKGVPTGDFDIERDAGRPALPKGKRIAKKSGKTYYENRENRIDRKQPPKRYPKLKDGGIITITEDVYGKSAFVPFKGETFMVEWTGDKPTKADTMISDKSFKTIDKSSSLFTSIHQQLLKSIQEGKVKMMEKGGLTGDVHALTDELMAQKIEIFLKKVQPYKYYFIDENTNTLIVGFDKEHKQDEADKFMKEATSSMEFFDADSVDMQFHPETGDTKYTIKLKKDVKFASGGKMEYGGILQPMTGGVNADPRFDIYDTGAFMRDGGEVAISNSKIVGKTISIQLPTELKPFKDKVVEEYKDFVVGKKGVWSKKYINSKNAMRFEDGGMNEGGDNEYLIMYRSDNPVYQNEDGFEGNPPDSMFADSPFEILEYLKESMPDDVELVSIEEASEMSMMKKGGYTLMNVSDETRRDAENLEKLVESIKEAIEVHKKRIKEFKDANDDEAMKYHQRRLKRNMEELDNYEKRLEKIKKSSYEYGGILQPMTGGVNADPRFDIYDTGAFMKQGGMMATGGATEHGLMEDDLILVVNGNMLGIKNQKSGERVIVDISKGTRQKSRYDEGGEIRWQDVQRGDSALVKSENKMGVIMKAYGRKFHLKFIDGTEKTYDANDLKFISSDDFAEGGLMKDFNKNFTTAYILQQQLAEKEKESQGVPSDVTTDYNYETTYYNEKYYPSRSHDGEKFASKELYNALRDGSGNLKGSIEKDIESEITAYFDENMVKTISGKDLHKMWKEGKGMNVEKKKKAWFGFKEGGKVKSGKKIKYQGKEGRIISKKGDMYFVEIDNYNPNGDSLNTVLREGEFEKMADGGLVAYADGDYNERLGKFKTLESAKKYAIQNKSNYNTITFEDEYGDNIVVTKDDNIKDIDWLFSGKYNNGGGIPEGYHMMPDGTIMPDSAHMARGGKMAKGGRLTNQEKLREEIYYLIHYMLVDRKFRINDLEKVKEGISKYGNKEQKELAKKITTPSFGKNEQLEEVLFKLKYSLPKETMASGGKVKFADKVASIKKSLLERKKVPKAVQKDYGKTFSPAEAEDSAKRIVGSQTYAERIKYLTRKRKK